MENKRSPWFKHRTSGIDGGIVFADQSAIAFTENEKPKKKPVGSFVKKADIKGGNFVVPKHIFTTLDWLEGRINKN